MNQITHIYTDGGQLHKDIVYFKPFLGIEATKSESTSWSDLFGKRISIKVFDSIMEMHKWKKENKDIFKIYGDVPPSIQFIASNYRKDIDLDREGIKIFNIDIEVYVEDGSFPQPLEAKHPINAITVNEMTTNTYTTFAFLDDYYPKEGNEYFVKCKNEKDLLEKFLKFWNKEDPQIVTGWNIDIFDIPYIINRLHRVFPDEDENESHKNKTALKLSIDRKIKKNTSRDTTGKEIITYTLFGHIIWDYIDLYKKYTQETRESYSLNSIATVELGKEKISYQNEYDNLNELYLQNFDRFIDYNIKDTSLVYELDLKLDYINLALSIMQRAKCQPEDIFGTVKPWDCIIYNELLSRKILCPPNNNHTRTDFIGGYVAEPKIGLHDWIYVFDIVSSYPNQIRSFNMSPETIVPDECLSEELFNIRNRYTNIDRCADVDNLEEIKNTLKKYKVSFTSNGQFFDITKEGIFPYLFSKFFSERKRYKKLVKEYKNEGKLRESKIADLYQYTFKILLNSGYGAISNNYFRYFDIRIGEAITSNGQVCVKGATKAIVNKFDIDCIYNDTDSCFFGINKIINQRFGDKEVSASDKLNFILKFGEKCIEPELKLFFNKMKDNMNMRELTIGMEGECIADVTLFVAKKRYIMNKVWDEGEFLLDKPKRKIRGVEIVRSSTPMIVRDRLKSAVELIFTTKSNNSIIEFIENFREEFFKLPIEEVAFPRSVSFGDYTLNSKGLPIAVKAALTFNNIIEKKKLKKHQPIADGNKIKFCYIKEPNIMGSYVIGFINKCPQEVKECFQIDYEMQYRKAFLDPISKILDSIGWQAEHKESLFDLFE